MTRIFLSYRRADSADITGRIDDRLLSAFGRKSVFKDVDSIPLGSDFRKYLAKAVSKCDVLLVVIGKDWLDSADDSGVRRLDNDADYVRIEIETALQRNIPVIPVLVRSATMPRAADLPPSISDLAYRNATWARPDPDFNPDIDRIIEAIKSLQNPMSSIMESQFIKPVKPASSEPTPPSSTEPTSSPSSGQDAARQRADLMARSLTDEPSSAKTPAPPTSQPTPKPTPRPTPKETTPRADATKQHVATPPPAKETTPPKEPATRLSAAAPAPEPKRSAPTTRRRTAAPTPELEPPKKSIGKKLLALVVLLAVAAVPAVYFLKPEWVEQLTARANQYLAASDSTPPPEPAPSPTPDLNTDDDTTISSPVSSESPSPTSDAQGPPSESTSPPSTKPVEPVPPPSIPTEWQLIGTVFIDGDGDGKLDEDEETLPDVKLKFAASNGETQDTATNNRGRFEVSIAMGESVIAVDAADSDLPPGSVMTTTASEIIPNDDGEPVERDFGFQPQGIVKTVIFNDSNRNSVLDENETVVSGVSVTITEADGTIQKVTDPVSVPVGMTTVAIDAADPKLPRGATLSSTEPQRVAVAAGEVALVPFGYQLMGSVSGSVFLDSNENGKHDSDERGIPDVTVHLAAGDNFNKSAVTDAKGAFTAKVPEGPATVEINQSDPALPPESKFINVPRAAVTVKVDGTEQLHFGLGDHDRVQITGVVFHDENRNGKKERNEKGVAGVNLAVKDSGGIVQYAETDEDGNYAFSVSTGEAVIVVIKRDKSGAVQPNVDNALLGMRLATDNPLRITAGSAKEIHHALQKPARQVAPEGFALIPKGKFTMGNSVDGVRQVTLTQDFYLAKHEVTQAQFESVMGQNPSTYQSSPNAPVEQVTWKQAMEYCDRLTRMDHASGKLPSTFKYTLPTEAQWEYACRAGTNDETYGQPLRNIAWYEEENGPHPVGQKAANPWGLHDMIGNVSEWCLDVFGPYARAAVTDPKGPTSDSTDRVIRGASYFTFRDRCTASHRASSGGGQGFRSQQTGFRVAAVEN